MLETSQLSNQFLIAMPTLADPNFSRTVTLLCDHTADGAMGLVINRPLDLDIDVLFDYLDIHDARKNSEYVPIFQGGPVQTERGFVLHRNVGEWEATLTIDHDMAVTMSQDIIQAIAQGEGPADYLIMLGYAGWGAGQLESELAANSWLNGPADPSIVFQTPIEQRWSAAAQHLGVELNHLSSDVGHA